MEIFSKHLFFEDSIDYFDFGGLGNFMPSFQDLLDRNKTNYQINSNDNNNGGNNKNLPSKENKLNLGSNYDENDLGIEAICSDDQEKIFKLTDLIVPLYDGEKESMEKYLRQIIETPKKDKIEKNGKDYTEEREKNEKEEVSKLMKKSKNSQKYSKINISYDEKFFARNMFVEKNNDEFKGNENIKNNIDEEKLVKEIKKDNLNKTKINYNYDDLIKNTLLQFKKHYNNSTFNQNENENYEKIDNKSMKIEEDITKDFKSKIKKN